jgi:hypothetical protein
MADKFQRVVHRAPLERGPTGEQFVKDRAQRVDVGRGGNVLGRPERLFRRHVGRGAHDAAILRTTAVVVDTLGQAEVGDLEGHVWRAQCRLRDRRGGRVGLKRGRRVTWSRGLGAQEDVARLQVAVNDATRVGVVDGAGQHLGHSGRGHWLLRLAVDGLAQRAAGAELEREERLVAELPGLEHLHDVRMSQVCDGLGLVAEALQVHGPGPSPGEDHLEGDEPVQADLTGLVHHAHPALAKWREHLVARRGRDVDGWGVAAAPLVDPGLVVGQREFMLNDDRVGRRQQGVAEEFSHLVKAGDPLLQIGAQIRGIAAEIVEIGSAAVLEPVLISVEE